MAPRYEPQPKEPLLRQPSSWRRVRRPSPNPALTMPWSEILDQPGIVTLLKKAIASDRVAHAYLFHGRDGVGKRAVALEFARALQCKEGGVEACGECLSCAKVKKLRHPDVHLLLPQPKDAEPSDVAERLERLALHPYAVVDFTRRPALGDASAVSNKQSIYSVDRIKDDLRRSMSLASMEGRYKVVIMTDAHAMPERAANAFLKLLEEPGPQTVFILTTNRLDLLLSTILSRCQRMGFASLTPEGIQRALTDREHLAPEVAATLACMADGSYARALDLARNEDLQADRELVLRFLRHSYSRRVDTQVVLIEEMARTGRERVKDILSLALSWIRDLVLYRTMGKSARLVNVDQTEAVARFVDNVPRADLDAMARLVEEGRALIEGKAHVKLTLTALSQALGQAMRAPHSGLLFTPLTEDWR